jgi:hypothetical protein
MGYVPNTRYIAGNNLTMDISSATLTASLDVASTTLKGLMSSIDKSRLDAIHALMEEGSVNDVVDSITEVLAVFKDYPEGADLVTVLSGKQPINSQLTEISALTGANGFLKKTSNV